MYMQERILDICEKFVDREPELAQIKQAIVSVAEGNTGKIINIFGVGQIGKTWLVSKLHDTFKYPPKDLPIPDAPPTLSCGVDLRSPDTSTLSTVLASLAQQLHDQMLECQEQGLAVALKFTREHIDQASHRPNEIARALVDTLAENSGVVIPVLVFDEAHRMEKDNAEEWRWLADKIIEPVVQKAPVLVLLASRTPIGHNPYLELAKQRRLRPIPENIRLGNFDRSALDVFVRDRRPNYDKTTRNALVMQLSKYTAGNPGLCDQMIDLLDPGRESLADWAELKGVVDKWIDDREVIPYEVQEERSFLQLVAVLRRISPGILQRFSEDVHSSHPEARNVAFINRLLRTQLVFYESRNGSYAVDDTVRPILEAMLQEDQPEQWKELHRWAYDLYYELLCEYGLDPTVFLIEFWYHAMCLELEPSEMTGRLRRLRREIVLGAQALAEVRQSVGDDPDFQRFAENKRESLFRWLDGFETAQSLPIRREVTVVDASYFKPTNLIGRAAEWQRICAAVDDEHNYSKVIGIVGDGGIGKTDLVRRVIGHYGRYNRVVIPQNTNGGIFDFALSELRDAEGLEHAIIEGIRAASGNKEVFHCYEEGRKRIELEREDRIHRAKLLGREAYDFQLYQEWIDDYNRFVEERNCRLLLCFDTLERLGFRSSAYTWLRFVLPHLRNTVVILSGREEKGSFTNKDADKRPSISVLLTEVVSEVDRVNRASFWGSDIDCRSLWIELGNLSQEETRKYLEAIDASTERTDLDVFYKATNGHPVKISILAGMPEDHQIRAFEELELDCIISDSSKQLEEMNEKIGRFLVDGEELEEISRRKRRILEKIESVKFDIISRHFVELHRGADPDPLSLYYLLVWARKGLTSESLAFILNGEDGIASQVEECEHILYAWRQANAPLVKEYRTEAEPVSLVLVLHDVVYEMFAKYWRGFHAYDAQEYKYGQRLVDYYRQRLRRFEDLSSEESEAWLVDTMYYETLLDPHNGLSFFKEQLDRAIRRGRWSLVSRLRDEWHMLAQDPFVYNLVQRRFPESERVEAFERAKSLIVMGELNLAREELEQLFDTAYDLSAEPSHWVDLLKEQDQKQSLIPGLWTLWSYVKLSVGSEPENDLVEAESRLNTVIHYLTSHESLTQDQQLALADAYATRGHIWDICMRADRAREDLSRAMSILDQIKLFTDETRALVRLTDLSIILGALPQAEVYAARASELGQIMGKDAVARLLSWKAKASVHRACGNLLRAESLLMKIFDGLAWSGLSEFDLRAVHFDLARVRAQAISQGLRVRDYDLEHLHSDIDAAEKAFRQANKSQVCQIERSRLQIEWGLLYLHISSYLIDEVQCQLYIQKAQARLHAARDLLDAYAEGHEIQKATLYLYLARLALLCKDLDGPQGALSYVRKAQEQADIVEDRFKQEIRASFRKGRGLSSPRTPGEYYPELRLAKAQLELIAGHLILKKGQATSATMSDALDHYQEAVSLFDDYSELGFVSSALDEIWQNVTEIAPDPEELCYMLMQNFPDDSLHEVPRRILKEGLELRCEMARLAK